jgi:hypothetical protein
VLSHLDLVDIVYRDPRQIIIVLHDLVLQPRNRVLVHQLRLVEREIIIYVLQRLLFLHSIVACRMLLLLFDCC